MHNLKSIKVHSLKAHLDRLTNTAEALAELSAGEVLAGRLHVSQELARLCAGLQNIRFGIELQAERVRGAEAAEMEP